MNSINYGGLVFTNPVPIAYALPPKDPGIYAIQVRSLSYGPMPYQPIAFGVSDNLAAVVVETVPAFEHWQAHRLAGSGLFVSYCMLRYQSESYRDSMAAELAAQYLPSGGALIRPAEPAQHVQRDVE
ncbi:MAG: hypothetical protein ABI920_14285 [Casimicrobiaceae bacterium]